MTYAAEVLADSPTGYWRLGETSGTVATDFSGNGRHATYVGSPTLGATGLLAGDTDKAMQLTANAAQCASIANPSWLSSSTTAYTVEAMINLTSAVDAASGDALVSRYQSAQFQLLLWRDTTGKLALQSSIGGSTKLATGTTTLAASTTYHVVGTWDGSNLRVYVNGILEGTTAASGALVASTAAFEIGRYSAAAATVPGGRIDEVAFYNNSALSGTRIAAHASAAFTAPNGSIALSGDSFLSFADFITSTSYDGGGALSLAGGPGIVGAISTSGSGLVDGAETAMTAAGTLDLSGSGLFARSLDFPLDGAGALTGTGFVGLPGSGATSGSGTLVATGPSSGFSGEGTLTGTVALTERSGSVSFSGSGGVGVLGLGDSLNASTTLTVTQTHAEEIGWFRIFATPPGGETEEITMFRDIPTQVSSLSTKDPFSEEICSISFPQITLWDTPGEGDLAWLVPYTNIDIVWHNTGTNSYSYRWEGFVVDESVSLGEADSNFTVECKGALYQLDNYLAKPTYPQQPIPYEILLRDAFDPFTHPGSSVEPLNIEWPAGWDEIVPDFQSSQREWFLRPWGVVKGQKWTGLTSRNTGNWEPTLTAYVQSMLSLMFTKGGGQWTIRNDRGRKPVLFLREPAAADDPNLVVIVPGVPGVSVQMSKDHTQSANVVYGRGQDIAGTQYSGMQVSLDGHSTYYEPFAFSPKSYPDESNPSFDPYTPRKEVQIEFPSGMNARAGEKVAQAQFKRFEDPGYTGEIVLKTDPKLADGTPIPRFLIRAGQSIMLQGFRGVDLVMHVTATEWSMENGEMRLTVDSKYRDALTVAEVRERTRDALATVRLISPGSFNTRTEDMLVPWSYSEGSGVLPRGATELFFNKAKSNEPFPWRDLALQYPPKDYPEYYVKINNPDRLTNADGNWVSWNGSIEDGAVPVRFAQQGTIRLTQIAAYDKNGNVLPVRFHVSVYNNSGTNVNDMPRYPGGHTKILAPANADFKGGQNNPFFQDAFEEILSSGNLNTDKGYTYHESVGFQMGWGNYYEPAGHSPGLASRGAPKTGMLNDEQPWRFDTTQDPNFNAQDPNMRPWKFGVGNLYVMIYCDDRTADYKGPVYFMGRFFRQEPGI